MYCYPKPNPKSVSEEEELQKFKLNKGTEWVLEKKGENQIVLGTDISNPDTAFS